jgi:3-deoxy-D-manno-octulosonic-acid transferase
VARADAQEVRGACRGAVGARKGTPPVEGAPFGSTGTTVPFLFMQIAPRLYTLALHGARVLLPLIAGGGGKLARGIRGRRGILGRMDRWAREYRDEGRPLVWFHAPSVGEGLQARAVLEELRSRRPDAQIVYTFFSPSAESLASSIPADFVDYLPLDLPADVRRALDAIRPSVIAFTKTEVWPNLAREAKRRGVRLALLSATLPPGSSRLSPIARPFLVPGFGVLDRLSAISQDDADRFVALGIPPERRSVMGDARFDQVCRRAAAVRFDDPLLRRLQHDSGMTLVAGSTWPADEERLIAALGTLRESGAGCRLILVPHEPSAEKLEGAETVLRRRGFAVSRLSECEAGAAERVDDVVLVDRVGVLGELYALADIAYVGGGFGRAGLHSVLEPAAFGAPVLFGPRHTNAREAAELIRAGGAFSVDSVENLTLVLGELLLDAGSRSTAGERARAYVQTGLGAARRGSATLEELLA